MHYYFDTGEKFISKIQACEHSIKTGNKFKFYYHDDVYSNLNWHIEPTESLEFYYKEQAQRIRDNYDYVILAYSGGHDSTNILETFYYNNIKLDKIFSVGAMKKDSKYGVDENHNGELYHNVIPYIKELELESIFELCDYSDLIDDPMNLSIGKYGENWIDYVGAWFSPHHWYWMDIEKYVVPKEQEGKKVAIIFGRDKPFLLHDMDRPDRDEKPSITGFYFTDSASFSYGELGKSNSCDRINFYWDPTYTNILHKQVHELNKQYLSGAGFHYNPNIGQIFDHIFETRTVNDVVYKLKKPLKYKSPKSLSRYVSLRDQYMLSDTNSKLYKFHQAGIDNMKRRLNGMDLDYTITTYSKFYEVYNKNV